MIEQKAFRGRLWAACGTGRYVRKMWECFTLKKRRGPDQCWQMRTRKEKMEQTASKEELELVRPQQVTCGLRVTDAQGILRGEIRRLGELSRRIPSVWASCVKVRENVGMK